MNGLINVLLILGIALGLVGIALYPDNSKQIELRQYCRMVHDETWPDYNHVYFKECNPNGGVNWEYVYGGAP